MKRICKMVQTFLLAAVLPTLCMTLQGQTFQTIDDPAAASGPDGGTVALGISGTNIVGSYLNDYAYGFLYNGSAYTTLSVPNHSFTIAAGISGNTIVGWYTDGAEAHGFVETNGVYTTLDDPNAAAIDNPTYTPPGGFGPLINESQFDGWGGTFPTGISGNNITGWYVDSSGNAHGFVYNGSTYTTLDDPNGVGATYAQGIDGNNVAGWYMDASGNTHGFLYNGRTYTTLDDPKGADTTFVLGILGGNFVGYYDVAIDIGDGIGGHGFLDESGTYTTVDYPNALAGSATELAGISGNIILGGYLDSSGQPHGFTYTPGNVSTGSLEVSITPAAAITDGAQWQVDGGTWLASGATVSGLAAGSHTVSFSTISAWVTPASLTVNVKAKATNTVSGTYVVQPGSLQVIITPASVVSAGAQWRVNGGAYQASGMTVTNVSPPSATISFKAINGWATPANQVVTINNGQITYAGATYLDTTPPKVAITNVPVGFAVSNALFVVRGTASDNVAVSNVVYSLNGSGWLPANNYNQWSNWTAAVTLTPGSNSILVEAMDTSGNVSTVASNSVRYVVSAVLTVQTNLPGWGTITPNDNGAALQIGSPYTLTATAATGFKFLNWSNNFGLVTNGAVLHFAMQTNLVLTATFADTTVPTLSITSPAAGQRVSGGTFTVTGKAGDNAAVASVALQVNHAGWFTATGLTNWSAAVALSPGTNTVQAFAVDTSGNHSLTNSVVFDEVVTNRLGVLLSGLGTLSPNDSNAWLEVGRNYIVTATPAAGFAFTSWGVTNATGSIGWSTNKATVEFMMASNLTLTASFRETTKPVVTITSPKAGQKVGVLGLTVAGTTTDNWQVTNVWCELGTNGWLPAGTTNGYKTWAVTNLSLVAGTNVIKVYGGNLGGNDSLTNSVTVVATNVVVRPSVLARAAGAESPVVLVTGVRMTPGGLVFSVHISGEASGVIEVSTNLADWATVTNFAGTNTSINFTDPGVTNGSQRFYRAVVP